MRLLRAIMFLGLTMIAIAALLDQLGRRPKDRDWHGRIVGIPYDFRPPALNRARQRLWNPKDERLIVPHVFGIGWTVNVYQLKRRIQLLFA